MFRIEKLMKAVNEDLKRLVAECHNTMTLEELENFDKPRDKKILIYV